SPPPAAEGLEGLRLQVLLVLVLQVVDHILRRAGGKVVEDPGGEAGGLPLLLVLLAEPGGLLFPLGHGETGESASVGAHGGGPPSWLGERMAPDHTRDRRPVYKGIVARPACPGQAKSW